MGPVEPPACGRHRYDWRKPLARYDIRLANEAWEAMFRAQKTIERELAAGLANTDEVQPSEYGVLHALSVAPRGLRITELGEDVLLTQAGMSRLITRMEARGLVERTDDPDDRRACRIRLTAEGSEIQRRVGSPHARRIGELLGRALDREQLLALRDVSRAILAAAANNTPGTETARS